MAILQNILISPQFTSAIIALAVSFIVCWLTIRNSRRQRLREKLDRAIDIALQYPHLDSDLYAANWIAVHERTPNDPEALRYEHYCCFIFNLMEEACGCYGFDLEKLDRQFFYAPEWIERHRFWWRISLKTTENTVGYCERFLKLINAYLCRRFPNEV
jgi:hypothetical protein